MKTFARNKIILKKVVLVVVHAAIDRSLKIGVTVASGQKSRTSIVLLFPFYFSSLEASKAVPKTCLGAAII